MSKIDSFSERLFKAVKSGEIPLTAEGLIEFRRHIRDANSSLSPDTEAVKGLIAKIREGLIEDGYQEINALVEFCDEALRLAGGGR